MGFKQRIRSKRSEEEKAAEMQLEFVTETE